VSETGVPAREPASASVVREPTTRWHRALDRLNVETSDAAEAALANGETAGQRQFLWDPLCAFARTLWRRERANVWQEAVLAGYARIARAAKLWEAEVRWREQHLESFERGHVCGVVRRGWRDRLEHLLVAGDVGDPIEGGRGTTRRVVTERGVLVVRRFRRGGWMRWLGEIYFGRTPRPLREFDLLLRARRCGLPVPEGVAAVIERRFVIAYRGHLFMTEVPDATPFLPFLQRHDGFDWQPLLAASLRRIHDAGLNHPDLNLGNILVVSHTGREQMVFVDLDRAVLGGAPLGPSPRARALRRLRRSAAKLDPAGRWVSSLDLDRMEGLYWAEPFGEARAH
jgi:3-deoxy-D-manno-octulosonic acid kinase